MSRKANCDACVDCVRLVSKAAQGGCQNERARVIVGGIPLGIVGDCKGRLLKQPGVVVTGAVIQFSRGSLSTLLDSFVRETSHRGSRIRRCARPKNLPLPLATFFKPCSREYSKRACASWRIAECLVLEQSSCNCLRIRRTVRHGVVNISMHASTARMMAC